MNDFPTRLRTLRKKMGFTQTEMAERMGLSMSYISQLEMEKRTPSDSVETLVRMMEEQIDAGMVGERMLNSIKDAAMRPLRGKQIPIIGWAHAGEAEAYEEIPEHWQDTMATECPMEKAFGVKLEGDSMEPKFSDGDVLIVMPDERAYSGCFAVVKFKNDGVLFRRLEMNGPRVRLMPLNERYLASDHAFDEFAWIYPVWGRFTQLWRR